MQELVIVIADLYAPSGAHGRDTFPAVAAATAGIAHAARYAARTRLPVGWRAWLAGWAGRADLGAAAPAEVAAAVLDDPGTAGAVAATRWIATPVALAAGMAHVLLEHRGILALEPAEQHELTKAFAGAFDGSGIQLAPLATGDFLLTTPGMPAHVADEPARSAGGDAGAALTASGTGALRRLRAELEMWLHSLALNEARRQRGELAVTAFWIWGATGGAPRRSAAPSNVPPAAWGCDAWLAGLWRLLGGACAALPASLAVALPSADERAVLVVQAGREWRESRARSLGEAVAQLDTRFVAPALRALEQGALARLTLVVGDECLALNRFSRWRFWRSARRDRRSAQ